MVVYQIHECNVRLMSRIVQKCLSIVLLYLVLERRKMYNGYFRIENNMFISTIQMCVDSNEILCICALGGDANHSHATGLDNQIISVLMQCKYSTTTNLFLNQFCNVIGWIWACMRYVEVYECALNISIKKHTTILLLFLCCILGKISQILSTMSHNAVCLTWDCNFSG